VILSLCEWGDPAADPVVCVHGVTSNGLRYRWVAERLAATRRVVAVDLRGHGSSRGDAPWRVATHVDDLVETTAELGIEHAPWIGHSYGGRIAYELAAAHPERVEQLVLLDPALQIPPAKALELAEAYANEAPFPSIEAGVAEWRKTVKRAPDDVLEQAVRDSLVREDGGWRGRYAKPVAVAAFGELAVAPPAPARVPTLLVKADEADLVTPEQRAWLESELGDLFTFTVVPGGHSVLLDAIDETATAVEAFLDGH